MTTDAPVNFREMFLLLREWFDGDIQNTTDRFEGVGAQDRKLMDWPVEKVSLKTWWPQYTEGDFRFELCVGILLVHRVAWPQVRTCIKNLDAYVRARGMPFAAEALLTIPVEDFEALVNASRFPKQKTWRIRKFCDFVIKSGGLERVFLAEDLGQQLTDMKCGFGKESRDTVLLYAANRPVFIADAYARKLLQVVGLQQNDDYGVCQNIFQQGIRRDFDHQTIDLIGSEYRPEELQFVLCNSPQPKDIPLMLLYQQYHAGIVELGKSKRWEEFRASLSGDN